MLLAGGVLTILLGAMQACGEDDSTTAATTSSPASSSASQSSAQASTGTDAGGSGGASGGGGTGGVSQGGMGPGGGDHLYSRALAASVEALAAGPQGSLLATGTAIGPTDFGGGLVQGKGGYDLFVVKYDAFDNVVFANMFGDGADQGGEAIAVDANGGIAVGGRAEGAIDFGGGPLADTGFADAVVARLDASGSELWAKRFVGGTSGTTLGVAIAANGSVYAVGNATGGPIDFGGGAIPGGGALQVFVVAFDASGNHLWSMLVGDAGNQYVSGVAVDAAANVYVTGSFEGSITFGGSTLTSAGNFDVFLVKLDAAGNHLWSKPFGDASSQFSYGVATDAAGNVVVAGSQTGAVDYGGGPLTAAGGTDAFVARFDASGNHVWSHIHGNSANQRAYAVGMDAAGDIALTGSFGSSIDFGGGMLASAGDDDIFVVKLSAAGSHIWSKRFGDFEFQNATTVAADTTSVAIAGNFLGTLNFGGNALTGEHFIARLAP